MTGTTVALEDPGGVVVIHWSEKYRPVGRVCREAPGGKTVSVDVTPNVDDATPESTPDVDVCDDLPDGGTELSEDNRPNGDRVVEVPIGSVVLVAAGKVPRIDDLRDPPGTRAVPAVPCEGADKGIEVE